MAPNGNYYTGTIENAANIAWGSNRTINFSELLSARTGGMKVALTNDANAAAVGEMTYGAARGHEELHNDNPRHRSRKRHRHQRGGGLRT